MLELSWKKYRSDGDSDVFVEFTLSLNGLTEQLNHQHLPGLVRACQELENTAWALVGDQSTHPIAQQQTNAIERQLSIILDELKRYETPAVSTRRASDSEKIDEEDWGHPRKVLIISHENHPWTASLSEQLCFFGLTPEARCWDEPIR